MPLNQSPAATAYAPTCPQCGATLQPVVLDPDTPPWLCPISRLGWWVVELEPAHRSRWNPNTRSFHHAVLPAIRDAIRQERATATMRGTSALPEQLPLLSLTQLQPLATRLEAKIPAPYTPPPTTLDPTPKPIVATGPVVDAHALVTAAIKTKTVTIPPSPSTGVVTTSTGTVS